MNKIAGVDYYRSHEGRLEHIEILPGFEVPRSSSTWCAANFYWWALANNWTRVAEIGVRGGARSDGGASTLALCKAMEYNGGVCFSADIEDCFTVERMIESENLSQYWNFQCLDSHNETPFGVEPASLDFLFIDGDHTYEGVSRDADLWRPLVKPGGLIAYHDPTSCAGVRRYITEHDLYVLHVGMSGLALENR